MTKPLESMSEQDKEAAIQIARSVRPRDTPNTPEKITSGERAKLRSRPQERDHQPEGSWTTTFLDKARASQQQGKLNPAASPEQGQEGQNSWETRVEASRPPDRGIKPSRSEPEAEKPAPSKLQSMIQEGRTGTSSERDQAQQTQQRGREHER
ncbi:hypothetical protein [Singulisphaera sp. PoT]|uniref:hypothetical protein n=1 Tax=Singulisphaera sp. PoT TaxID=3411797 RepID=UPI003BF5BE97